MKKLFFVEIIILIFTIACKESDKSNLIEVDFHESVNLSEIIYGDLGYVSLQTNDSNLIGKVRKVVKKDNNYFLLDNEISNKLFIYSDKGSLIHSIWAVGDGYGEYRSIGDFLIFDDEIHLFDDSNFTKLIFDREGNFIDEIPTPLYVKGALFIGEDSVFIYSPTNYSPEGIEGVPYVLKLMSKDLNRTYKNFFEYEEYLDDVPVPGLMSYNGDEFSFAKTLYDKVMVLDSNFDFNTKYQFDFGKYKWPLSVNEMKKKWNEAERKFLNGGIMSVVHRIMDTKTHFVFQTYMVDKEGYPDDEDRWLCIYDKTTKKCYAIHKVINDIDNGIFEFPVKETNGEFISFLDAEEMLGSSMKQNNPSKFSINEIGLFSNPIMLKYRLKKGIRL